MKERVATLLIEDNEMCANAIKVFLLEPSCCFDHEVTAVRSMRETRELLARNDYDLILLDLKLLNGSGVQLAREIRSLAPDAALVIMTATDDRAIEEEAMFSFADAYIVKGTLPVEEQLRIIRQAIWRSRARRDLSGCRGEQLVESVLEDWRKSPVLPPYQ